jgi:hypothetical protein
MSTASSCMICCFFILYFAATPVLSALAASSSNSSANFSVPVLNQTFLTLGNQAEKLNKTLTALNQTLGPQAGQALNQLVS